MNKDYYAIYYIDSNKYDIVDSLEESNKLRKGKNNISKKFSSEEKAKEWLEKCNNNEIKSIEQKKKYYAIYFREDNTTFISSNFSEVDTLIRSKLNYCRKFSSKEEAEEWLEKVKIVGKDVPPTKKNKQKIYYGIYFYENNSTLILKNPKDIQYRVYGKSNLCRKFSSKEETEKWLNNVKIHQKDILVTPENEKKYAIFLPDTREEFVVDSKEKAELIIKGKQFFWKKVNDEKKAEEWLFYLRNSGRFYYAVFFLDDLTSFITSDIQLKDRFIENRSHILKVFQVFFEADKWTKNMKKLYTKEKESLFKNDTLFFDSGTGRGLGTEVRITDYLGNSLLHELEYYKDKLNQFGNYNLGKDIKDNNYGELYGLYLALLLANQKNIKKISGDSSTVINDWKPGKLLSNKLNKDILDLIEKVRTLRNIFEMFGGEIHFIPGGINPADLGFHED